jgi:Sensors of blue-light using FAD
MSADQVRVMYLSRARHRMTHGELADLLAGARLRNAQHDITGLLIYDSGYFAQVLEGPRPAIEQLLANIAADARHDEYSVVSEGPITERYFQGWAMDSANLETMAESRHRGLRDLLATSSIADRPAVYRALVAFVEEHRKSR